MGKSPGKIEAFHGKIESINLHHSDYPRPGTAKNVIGTSRWSEFGSLGIPRARKWTDIILLKSIEETNSWKEHM